MDKRLSLTQILKLKYMDSNGHLVKNKANLTHLKTPTIWQFFLLSNTLLKNVHLISSLTELPGITSSSPLPLSATVEELSYQIAVRCGIMLLRDQESPSLPSLLTLNRLNSRSFSRIRHVFNYSSHS